MLSETFPPKKRKLMLTKSEIAAPARGGTRNDNREIRMPGSKEGKTPDLAPSTVYLLIKNRKNETPIRMNRPPAILEMIFLSIFSAINFPR